MAKITKKSQIKARETKLNKKSKEELIAIVLKKDNTERNLNNQIKSLKGEVNELSTKANNLADIVESSRKTLDIYKKGNDKLNNEFISISEKYKDAKESCELLSNSNAYFTNMLDKCRKDNRRICYGSVILIIIAFVIGFTVGVLW